LLCNVNRKKAFFSGRISIGLGGEEGEGDGVAVEAEVGIELADALR